MSLLRFLLLVFLMFGYFACAESEDGADAQEPRKTYLERNNDAHKAECCKRQPPQEAGLNCCGKKPMDPLTDTCCETGSEQALKGPSKRSRRSTQKQCGNASYNETTQLCCGPAKNKKVHDRTSDHHRCCGNERFDNRNQSCCYTNERLVILNNNEQLCCGPVYDKRVVNKTSDHHRCCGKERFDDRNQSCCHVDGSLVRLNNSKQLCCGPEDNKTVQTRTSDHHSCCGNELFDNRTHRCCHIGDGLQIRPNCPCCCNDAFDVNKHLCCGPNQTVLTRTSIYHQCCGNDQFDNRTHCCCHMGDDLQIQHNDSGCCKSKNSFDDNKQLSRGPNQPVLSRTSHHHHYCDNEQYHNRAHCCCDMEDDLQIQRNDSCCCKSVEQQTPAHSSVDSEAHKRLCRSSRQNKRCRCGRKERKCRCCSSDRCRALPVMCKPHVRVCWADCVSKRKPWMNQGHGSPGHHCCWRKTFRPPKVCCGGRRHERVHCCSVCSYNVEHQHVKRCSGTLFNLTSSGTNAQDALCCGSVLLLSEGGLITAVHKFYFPKTRFRCCRRRCYNPAVCSCCAGIHPINHMEHHQCKNIQDSRFLSVNSLNEAELCGGIHIGTLKSVSPHSVEFTDVLRIHGINGTVVLGSLNHTVPIPDGCSSSMLTPGTAYFFTEANVFVDPNLRSVLQSLHFIFSKCFHP